MSLLPAPVSVPLRSTAEAAGVVLTAVTAGPVGAGNAVFLDDPEGGTGFRLTGGPERFDAWSGDQHVLYVDVDVARRLVGVQGHWWYRGEYQVVDTPDGAVLEHRMLNVAKRGRWAVPLANRFFAGARERMAEGTGALAERLDR